MSQEARRDKLTSVGKFKAMILKLPKTKRIINNKKVAIGITRLELEILMIFDSRNIKIITIPTTAAGQKVKPFKSVRTKSDNKIIALKHILTITWRILLLKLGWISLIWAKPMTSRGRAMTKYMVSADKEPKGLKLIARLDSKGKTNLPNNCKTE